MAQIAGMPQLIVLRASEIMLHLEKDHLTENRTQKVKEMPKNNFQLSIFEPNDPKLEELKEKLKLVDVNTLSPIEALLKLNELKRLGRVMWYGRLARLLF